jgi:hypothetical protein
VKLTFFILNMLKLKSNHIKDFPFEEYAPLNESQLEDLAKTHYLTAFNSWMLPQIAHHYGTWKLVRNAAGKVDPNATAKENISTQWDIGLWKVCVKLKRGSLVKSQINPEFASYSALVPLILMGAKKYHGVKYAEWDIDETCRLIDKNLLEAMLWQPGEYEGLDCGFTDDTYYGLGSDRLIELRNQGLQVKSGPKSGTTQNPTSAWCLRGMQGTEFAKMPKLVGTMLTQIWVAHPSLRTEYMVLNPNTWDLMPPPLVSTEIFKQKPSVLATATSNAGYQDLPWLT